MNKYKHRKFENNLRRAKKTRRHLAECSRLQPVEIHAPHIQNTNSLQLRPRTIRYWSRLNPATKHWIINICIGLLIEILLHFGMHVMHFPFLINLQNGALDIMMRAHASLSVPSSQYFAPPKQTFVNIDDAAWRNPEWGGGEPYRPPRTELLRLIDQAFDRGANSVVVDITLEGGLTNDQDRTENIQFAQGLKRLLGKPYFRSNDKKLILTRTLRYPLLKHEHMQSPYLSTPTLNSYPEIREIPEIDKVIDESAGKIVVAAPYFVEDATDHKLRSWDLFQFFCLRDEKISSQGTIRVMPSVQLAVIANYAGTKLPLTLPSTSLQKCQPFPRYGKNIDNNEAENAVNNSKINKNNHKSSSAIDIEDIYWSEVQKAFKRPQWKCMQKNCPNQGINFADLGTHEDLTQNRVIFRTNRPFKIENDLFREISVNTLLDAPNGVLYDEFFRGRVIVIGQSYFEAGDIHNTPLGKMNGAMVLINANDSLSRFGLVTPVNAMYALPITFFIILVVGYVFAHWKSLIGTLISTTIVLSIMSAFSFLFLGHGIWLDFALPLLGIQCHRIFKSYEEWVLSKQRINPQNSHK